jgi:signal peptidase I
MKLFMIALAVVFAVSLYAQTAVYTRGDIVRLSAFDDGTLVPDAKVFAIAGDKIRLDRTGVFVNDIPVNLSSEFLAGLPETMWVQTVPEGHYFVAADVRTVSGATRFWGLVPAKRIVAKI